MGPCPPLSDTGIDVPPEQFWNCAEVKIESSAPTTPAPTGAPTTASPTLSAKPTSVTPAPVTPAPVTPAPTGGNGCCSQNYKDCDATWCGDTKEQCLSCGSSGDKTWLVNGPVTGCIARFGDCTNDVDGCCAPSSCIGNEFYRQCRPDLTGTTPTTPPPVPAPTAATDEPTASPSSGPTATPTAGPSDSSPVSSPADCSSFEEKLGCNDTQGCSWKSGNGGVCAEALSTLECSEFDGMKRKCKRKGCRWKNLKKLCEGRWD